MMTTLDATQVATCPPHHFDVVTQTGLGTCRKCGAQKQYPTVFTPFALSVARGKTARAKTTDSVTPSKPTGRVPKSGYRGVTEHHSGRWAATLFDQMGQKRHLGMFDTAIEAARAVDKQALAWFGEKARLNFPEKEGESHGETD